MNTKLQQEIDYAKQSHAKVEAAQRHFFEIQKQLEQLQRQTENYTIPPIEHRTSRDRHNRYQDNRHTRTYQNRSYDHRQNQIRQGNNRHYH